MKIGLVLAPLVIATTTAYAQAPGDYAADEGDLAPPGMSSPVVAAPVVVVPAPRPLRWSVGLSFGSLGVAPHHQADNQTQFDLGQIAIRYRPWRHLEIELALGGGGESLPDGQKGDRQVSESVLALRYRFNPNQHWNWWLMAGMGSFTVASQYASQEEKDAAVQSTLQFGVGIEHRWRHFALQAEIRAVGVAPQDGSKMTVNDGGPPMLVPDGSTTYPPKDPQPYASPSGDGWKGGQSTIGASYYF